MEKNWIWAVLTVIILVMFISKGSPTQSTLCAQVITPACNPATNAISNYPTPCDIPQGWTIDLNQCSSSVPVNRQIIKKDTKTDVTLKISGTGKFGGIIKENIPSGLQVTGISSINVGAGGSAIGKLTGNVYEIAFIIDNANGAFITYTLSKTQDGIAYDFSGNFEFAEGYTELKQGVIGGDRQIFKCVRQCIRTSNLCTPAAEVPDSCGSTCTNLWGVTKRSDADANCNNYVENPELMDAVNKWVSDTPPYNNNIHLLNVIGGWVKSTSACTKNAHGVWFCQGEIGVVPSPLTLGSLSCKPLPGFEINAQYCSEFNSQAACDSTPEQVCKWV